MAITQWFSGVVLCLSTSLAFSEALIEGPAPLHFVEQADWAPFTPPATGITQQGLAYDLLQLIFTPLQRPVQLESLPREQVLQRAQLGQVDGISLTALDERRIGYLAYSEPLMLKRAYLYYNVNAPVPAGLLDWDPGQHLRLGIVKNRSFGPLFQQQRSQLPMELVESESLDNLFKWTSSGILAGFLAYEMNAAPLLQQAAYQGKIARMPVPYYQDAYYLAVGRHSAAMPLLEQINRRIAELHENGELEQVLKRYGATD